MRRHSTIQRRHGTYLRIPESIRAVDAGGQRELADLKASVGLHYARYNFVRFHRTLRCTPAMAAGVTDRLWSVEELICMAFGSE
jgi:hypothetical protein